jgi:hypothetical protein
MRVNLDLEKETNELKIMVDDLDILGGIPVTWAINIEPLNLEELLPLPENKHLRLNKNTIFIKPFGLFPPPRISGDMEAINVEPEAIYLSFTGKNVISNSLSTNGITLDGGSMKFGKLAMAPVSITIRDKAPESPFRFSLYRYDDYLDTSDISLDSNGSVKVVMPDAAAG